jgi:protein-S-isoprenylcysteine O-methyltransferase Ste14
MSRARKSTPLLVTLAGSVGLGGLAIHRLALHDHGAGRLVGIAAFAIYLAWLAWESRVSVSELDKQESSHDRSTMELCAAAKCLLLFGAFAGGGTIDLELALAGIALMVPGILVRAWAVQHLGAAYSHRIRPPDPLRDDGPYRVLRHPAYLGTLLAHTGLVMVFANWYSIAGLLLLWYPAVFVRTLVEDRYLAATSGYAPYATRVGSRLIPGIW